MKKVIKFTVKAEIVEVAESFQYVQIPKPHKPQPNGSWAMMADYKILTIKKWCKAISASPYDEYNFDIMFGFTNTDQFPVRKVEECDGGVTYYQDIDYMIDLDELSENFEKHLLQNPSIVDQNVKQRESIEFLLKEKEQTIERIKNMKFIDRLKFIFKGKL